MIRTRIADLPHRGMSHQFIGAEHDTTACAYLVDAPPGLGPPLHRHPYDKIAFIQSGLARWTVEGEEFDAGAGEILVVKAGEAHRFRSVGPEPLIQIDFHHGPRFEQENLE
jgi:mannose-6-phosphate isomerase-like protein (cupin superfamily)